MTASLATTLRGEQFTDGQISLLSDVFMVARHYSRRTRAVGRAYEVAVKANKGVDNAVHDWLAAQAGLHAKLAARAVKMVVTIPDIVASAAADDAVLSEHRAEDFFRDLFEESGIADDFTA